MDNPSSSTDSLSSLLCHETGAISLGEEELGGGGEDPYLASLVACNGFSDSEDEYVQLLLKKERTHSSVLAGNPHNHTQNSSPSALIEGKLTKIARLDAISYIFHVKALLGFQFQTAYLSVTYLDRFLSLRTLDSDKAWATELLSMGCLSLAAKFQERHVPGLSSFQAGNFRFDVKSIQRMELLILNTLDWKMDSITPFSFSPYFINKLFSGPPQPSTLTRTLELILATMEDVSLIDHYPSSIAAAAVLMSLEERLTGNELHSKINSMACSRFLDIEDVCICYITMQKLDGKQTKILKLVASPDLTPIKLRMGGSENSPATSVSSRRKRLYVNDSDDKDLGLPDKRQHENENDVSH